MCSSKFKFSNLLKTQIKSHPWENPYNLTLCGKCFISCHHIKQHMKNHAGDIPYPCALCGKKLSPGISKKENFGFKLERVNETKPYVARDGSPGNI